MGAISTTTAFNLSTRPESEKFSVPTQQLDNLRVVDLEHVLVKSIILYVGLLRNHEYPRQSDNSAMWCGTFAVSVVLKKYYTALLLKCLTFQ